MSEYRDELERIGDRAAMPEPAFDRMLYRRERRDRTRRISAGVLGLAITAGLVLALASSHSGMARRPATEPTPIGSNGVIAYSLPVATRKAPGGIYVVEEGGEPRLAISSPDGTRATCLTFSPDGTRLAFTRRGGSGPAEVLIVPFDSSGEVAGVERSVATVLDRPCPEWAPDGQRLLFADRDGVWSRDVDGESPPIPLFPGVDPHDLYDLEWSPDGSLIAASFHFDATVLIVSARGGGPVASAGAIAFGELSWGSSGDHPIVIGQAAIYEDWPVWLIHPSGGDRRELTVSGRTFDGYGSPSWSPDGTSLALLDNRGELDSGIMIVRPDDDSWDRIPLPPVDAPSGGRLEVWGGVRWSPDGQRLLVASGCSLHSIAADGRGEAILLSSPTVHPQACLRPPVFDWQAVQR